MRSTIHLVTARDCLALQPSRCPCWHARSRARSAGQIAGADVEEVVAAGRELLEQSPRTRAELARRSLRAGRTPTPIALAQAVTFHMRAGAGPAARPLGRARPGPRWAPAAAGSGASSTATRRRSTRSCCATSPPSARRRVGDMRTWSGLTGLRAVLERLRPQLRDVPRRARARAVRPAGRAAARPGDARAAALPARVRQPAALARRPLARARGARPRAAVPDGELGRHAAGGRVLPRVLEGRRTRRSRSTASRRSRAIPPARLDEIAAEGERLAGLIAPGAGARRVRFAP